MSLIISNEQLISEIKKRPTLFNKNLEEYNDRKLRLRLWNQICQEIIPKWNELSMTERLLRRKEVQSRWKNLRSCFWRDFNFQKNEKLLGQPNRKRRWLFFNRLSFLLTPEQKLLISNNNTNRNDCDPLDDNNQIQQQQQQQQHDNYDDDNLMDTLPTYTTTTIIPITSPTITPTQTPTPPPSQPPLLLPTQTTTTTTDETTKKSELYDELIHIVKEQHKDDNKIDEEKMFLLSLLPILKKFNDEQKFVAKIEILDTIRRIQLYQYSTISTNHNYYNLITQQQTTTTTITNHLDNKNQNNDHQHHQNEVAPQIDNTIKIEDL